MIARASVRAMAGVALGLLFAFAAPVQVGASAAATTAFRTAMHSPDAAPWTDRHTTPPQTDIVASGRGAVYAVGKPTHAPVSRSEHLSIRQEIVSQSEARRARARSSLIDLQIDCAAAKVRVNRVSFFPSSGLRGPPERVSLAGNWTDLPEGTYVSDVARRVCAAPAPERRPTKGAP